jgi:hypothetical protein
MNIYFLLKILELLVNFEAWNYDSYCVKFVTQREKKIVENICL